MTTFLDHQINSATLIKAYTEWLYGNILNGWNPFYVNIMFGKLSGSESGIVGEMHRGIYRFYGRFCSEFHRDPRSPAARGKLPQFWLLPDKPTFKYAKQSLRDVTINGGLHFNGTMLIPSASRFKECPIQHIELNQHVYARKGIERIYVEPITRNIFDVTDYSAKTVKRGRAGWDDVLILPQTVSQLPSNKPLEIDAQAKQLKDIQSSLNVSDETALQMCVAKPRK